jgi:putative transposase
MRQLLEVSKSGYYASIDRRAHARIQATVRELYARSRGSDGSDKIAQQMQQSEELERACRNTVARAMRELGPKSNVCKG